MITKAFETHLKAVLAKGQAGRHLYDRGLLCIKFWSHDVGAGGDSWVHLGYVNLNTMSMTTLPLEVSQDDATLEVSAALGRVPLDFMAADAPDLGMKNAWSIFRSFDKDRVWHCRFYVLHTGVAERACFAPGIHLEVEALQDPLGGRFWTGSVQRPLRAAVRAAHGQQHAKALPGGLRRPADGDNSGGGVRMARDRLGAVDDLELRAPMVPLVDDHGDDYLGLVDELANALGLDDIEDDAQAPPDDGWHPDGPSNGDADIDDEGGQPAPPPPPPHAPARPPHDGGGPPDAGDEPPDEDGRGRGGRGMGPGLDSKISQ